MISLGADGNELRTEFPPVRVRLCAAGPELGPRGQALLDTLAEPVAPKSKLGRGGSGETSSLQRLRSHGHL